MKLSLVVVCHHSSEVLSGCLSSFRKAADAAGVVAEVIVVEQSEDDAEAAAVAEHRPDRMVSRPNHGYAAGLNAGVGAASGEVVFLANPDIEFLDGSVAALLDALRRGAGVAGPQLLWDRAGEVLLPVPEDPRPTAELGRTIRRRWPRFDRFERRVAKSWRAWTAVEPIGVPSLRGPLMAVRRPTLERLGPLDEDYFLYYEETEWLLRALRTGVSLQLVPRARVVHRWGHATARRGDRNAIEERSRSRFFERNYPPAVRAAIRRLSKPGPSLEHRFRRVGGPSGIGPVEADAWLLSIVDRMEPFVGCLGAPTIPPAALELSSSGRWYAVAVRRTGNRWNNLGAWTWESG